MKKFIIPAILLIILAVIFVIFLIEWERQPQETSKSTTNLNGTVSDTGIIISTTAEGGKLVESKQFDFRLILQPGLSFSSDNSIYGYDVFEASIFRPNPNTSEKKNRETPNGFNTSVDDSLNIFIYKNRDGLTANDESSFRQWLAVRSLGLDKVTIAHKTISSYSVVKTVEADGIDSFGQYYYFFGPSYIYVFGSDDFTDTQIQDFLSQFTILDI